MSPKEEAFQIARQILTLTADFVMGSISVTEYTEKVEYFNNKIIALKEGYSTYF